MPHQPTHYEILRVKPSAKTMDINRAYKRLTKEMESETAAPDARLAARAKVAFEILSDPDKRDAYDQSLRTAAVKRPARRWIGVVAGIATLGAVAVVASMYAARSKEAEAAAPLPPEKLVALGEQVSLPMEELRISGEVARTGVAVATGPNEMVTPCHTLAAGAQITVGLGARTTHADMARADIDRDICMLRVKDSNEVVAKLRGSDPAPGEKVYAVVRAGAKPSELHEGHVSRVIADPKGGKAYEVVIPGAIPNGSPLFDAHGNVVGLFTAPHDFGAGLTMALAASRVSQTVSVERAAAESAEAALAAQPKTSNGTRVVDDAEMPGSATGSTAADSKPKNIGEAYRKLDQQRSNTLDKELMRQVNGPTPEKR
jgi:hypothetical protein